MIQITHKITSYPGVRLEYRSYDDGHVRLEQQKNKSIYFHRQPILNIQQPRKRSSSYLQLQQQRPKLNFDTKSQMNQSNLSRLNQELQERTNYYARHGKYDSKWTQQHHDNFKSTQRSSSSHSGRSGHYKPITTQQRPEEYYRPPSVRADPIYLPTSYQPVRPGHYVSYNHTPDMGIQFSKNVYETAYAVGQAKQQVKQSAKDVAQGVANTANAAYQTASDAKDVVKVGAKVAANEAKESAKQATKAVVGNQNYSLLSTIKHAVSNLFKNAVEPIVEVKDAVVDQAKVAKDAVVGQAVNAKQAVKDASHDAKYAVKDAARDVRYQAQRDIRDTRYAVGSGIRDSAYRVQEPHYMPEFGTKESISSSSQGSFSMQKPIGYGGRQVHYEQIPHYVTTSPHVNEVSPIQYSKRQFSRPPITQITYFWIYMLLAIGVFLVIFQILK